MVSALIGGIVVLLIAPFVGPLLGLLTLRALPARFLRLQHPLPNGTSLHLVGTSFAANLIGLVIAWGYAPQASSNPEDMWVRGLTILLVWALVQVVAVAMLATARIRQQGGMSLAFGRSCAIGLIFALSNVVAFLLVALLFVEFTLWSGTAL